jgi:hypothetical protein
MCSSVRSDLRSSHHSTFTEDQEKDVVEGEVMNQKRLISKRSTYLRTEGEEPGQGTTGGEVQQFKEKGCDWLLHVA